MWSNFAKANHNDNFFEVDHAFESGQLLNFRGKVRKFGEVKLDVCPLIERSELVRSRDCARDIIFGPLFMSKSTPARADFGNLASDIRDIFLQIRERAHAPTQVSEERLGLRNFE